MEHGSNAEGELFNLDQITGDICPQGHYCPTGSAQPLKCPPGRDETTQPM